MKLYRIENSLLQENTYIIYENDKALIIDPGSDFNVMKQFIDENQFNEVAIYLTHGHYDHILSCQKLIEEYHAKVYTYEKEVEVLENANYNMSLMFNEKVILENIIPLQETLKYFEQPITIYHVPGHTQGHSMLEVKPLKALFTGDFIFAREIGRCDLPTGSLQQMYESLDKLSLMDPSLTIYPGHGPSTTLKEELKYNPYLNRN